MGISMFRKVHNQFSTIQLKPTLVQLELPSIAERGVWHVDICGMAGRPAGGTGLAQPRDSVGMLI